MMQTSLQIELFSLQDLKYKEFHQKLMPTVNPDKVIGIRTPVLRKFAKEFGKRAEAESFLKNLPHKYYEEDNLHAFLLEEIKDYETLIEELNKFLPFVDNWATCDMMRPKILKNHKIELLEDIKRRLNSKDTYTIRFAVNCLMLYYLEEDFKPEYLDIDPTLIRLGWVLFCLAGGSGLIIYIVAAAVMPKESDIIE